MRLRHRGWNTHVFYGLAATSQDRAQEIALVRSAFSGPLADLTTVAAPWLRARSAAACAVLRPHRIRQRRDVDGTEIERDDLLAEATDPISSASCGVMPAVCSSSTSSAWLVERGIGVADLLTLEIL